MHVGADGRPRVQLAWVDLGLPAALLLVVAELGFRQPLLPPGTRLAASLGVLAWFIWHGWRHSQTAAAVMLGVALAAAAALAGWLPGISLIACLYAGISILALSRASPWLGRANDWADARPASAVLSAWPVLTFLAFATFALPGCTTERVTYAPHYLPQTLLHSAFMAVSVVTLTGIEIEPLTEWFSPNGLFGVWLVMILSGGLIVWSARQMVRIAGGTWTSLPCAGLAVLIGSTQLAAGADLSARWLFDQTSLLLHAGLTLDRATQPFALAPLLLGAMLLPLSARLPRVGSRYVLPWLLVLVIGQATLLGVGLHRDIGKWTPGQPHANQTSIPAGTALVVSARSHGVAGTTPELPPAGWAVVAALVFVGGLPGTPAAGLGTTTLAVLLAGGIAAIRGRDQPRLFGHLAPAWVHRAMLAAGLYVALHATALIVVLTLERGAIATSPSRLALAPANASSIHAAWITFNACSGVNLCAEGARALTPGSLWVLMVAMLLARVVPIALALHWLTIDRRGGANSKQLLIL